MSNGVLTIHQLTSEEVNCLSNIGPVCNFWTSLVKKNSILQKKPDTVSFSHGFQSGHFSDKKVEPEEMSQSARLFSSPPKSNITGHICFTLSCDFSNPLGLIRHWLLCFLSWIQADEDLLKIKIYGGTGLPEEMGREVPDLRTNETNKLHVRRIGFFTEGKFVHQNPGQIDPNVIFSRDCMHQKRRPWIHGGWSGWVGFAPLPLFGGWTILPMTSSLHGATPEWKSWPPPCNPCRC